MDQHKDDQLEVSVVMEEERNRWGQFSKEPHHGRRDLTTHRFHCQNEVVRGSWKWEVTIPCLPYHRLQYSRSIFVSPLRAVLVNDFPSILRI